MATLDEIKERTGVEDFHILSSEKVFKIKAAFNLDTGEDEDSSREVRF